LPTPRRGCPGCGGGAYAETTVLSAPNTARIPAGLSATVAATLPVAGTTAVDALDQLGLPAGATVLVNGVGGGVGLAVARLAIGRELRVIGTGSTAKREHAEAIGVRFIDYAAENVVAAARELVPDGFDGIVDLVGGTSLRTVARLARDPRNVIAVGDVSVSDLGGRFVERRLDRANLERSARLALDGVLAPVITAVHPLSDAGRTRHRRERSYLGQGRYQGGMRSAGRRRRQPSITDGREFVVSAFPFWRPSVRGTRV
jgi:NADPH2:quinone reductase